MGTRWDRPPITVPGDATEEVTYAAVGYALTQWERLELNLSHVHARLAGLKTGSRQAVDEYSSGRIFLDRTERLMGAFCAYSKRSPNQHVEGLVRHLIKEATGASVRRNDIAHGAVDWVGEITDLSKTTTVDGKPHFVSERQYFLFPSYYNRHTLNNEYMPKYMYSSRDIRAFGRSFAGLAEDVRECFLKLPEPSP